MGFAGGLVVDFVAGSWQVVGSSPAWAFGQSPNCVTGVEDGTGDMRFP